MAEFGKTAGAIAAFAIQMVVAGMLLGIGLKIADKLVNRIGKKEK